MFIIKIKVKEAQINLKKVINKINIYVTRIKQNLEKNKIVAKMQLLRHNGLLTHILPGVSNAFLMSTVGGAFSSAEFIHYKEMDLGRR